MLLSGRWCIEDYPLRRCGAGTKEGREDESEHHRKAGGSGDLLRLQESLRSPGWIGMSSLILINDYIALPIEANDGSQASRDWFVDSHDWFV